MAAISPIPAALSQQEIIAICKERYSKLPNGATCELVAKVYKECESILGIGKENLSPLGKGSFGKVYKFNSPFGTFAIKKIDHNICQRPVETYHNAFLRIVNEWNILSALTEKRLPYFPWLIIAFNRTPCTCKSLSPCHLFESQAMMTIAPGYSVSHCVKKKQLLSTMSDITTFIAQVFHAEKHLNQELGIVHADPSIYNIMWDKAHKRVTVIDFGNMAKITECAQGMRNLCTPTACSPESYSRLNGRLQKIGPAVIYAYGTTIFHAIYGREIFKTWYQVTHLLQSGLDVSRVITHRFPADDFQKGFDVMVSGKSGKVILDWE